MKKNIIKVCIICIFFLILLTLKSYAATELKDALSGKTEMIVGDTQEIKLNDKSGSSIYDLSKAKVTSWTSSDSKIVTISSKETTENMTIVNPMTKGYEHKATLTAKKAGKVTITVHYDVSANTSFISYESKLEITVKNKEQAIKEKEQQIKELDLTDKYKTVPNNNADAQTIKYFIISDKEYNDSKALKNVAKTNIQKIKDWKKTIDDKIKTDRSHYGQPKQYGSIRDLLSDIISANDKGTSTDDAISSNASAIEDTYDLTNESNQRISNAIRMQISAILGDEGEDRTTFDYKDVLDDTNFYTDVGDINTTDAQKVETTVSKIISIITNIGIILSAIILAIMGVKYMIGSAEERAEYKKDMIPYLVGATLLFSICIVTKIMQFLGQEISNI